MARPEKEIDWEKVRQRMEAGCSAKTIASKHNVDLSRFYEKFKKEFGCGFADYAGLYTECGKDDIEYIYHMKALSGNVSALNWLAQVKCGHKIPESAKTDSPIQSDIDLRHQNMFLQARLDKLEAQIANQSKTE